MVINDPAASGTVINLADRRQEFRSGDPDAAVCADCGQPRCIECGWLRPLQ